MSTPKPVQPLTAWLCLLANLLALPGLGSILAGRRIGFVQAGMALVGFALTLFWAVWFIGAWAQSKTLPLELNWQLGVGTAGVLLFGAAWVWALVTSRRILRQAER